MKKYIKPNMIEEEVLIEDIIATSTDEGNSLNIGDFFTSGGKKNEED